MSVEAFVDETTNPAGVDWRAMADELASALEETMLRNPNLTPRGWDRGHGALQRYERASGAMRSGSAGVPEVS
ncbi:MAG: hypothetical protein QOE80_3287 [Actinomycetota bacterium]|jgi:hypothetical protein|nr:hypothetical protein [Actinomycetota bacterium]